TGVLRSKTHESGARAKCATLRQRRRQLAPSVRDELIAVDRALRVQRPDRHLVSEIPSPDHIAFEGRRVQPEERAELERTLPYMRDFVWAVGGELAGAWQWKERIRGHAGGRDPGVSRDGGRRQLAREGRADDAVRRGLPQPLVEIAGVEAVVEPLRVPH